jgi:single-strand DNA-binding protein
MLNKVILIGRLTRDPEMRYTPQGVAVASFAIAVERPYTNAQKEKEVDYINIVVWRQQAELCAQYLRKGRLVAIDGRLQIRNYDNSEGKKVYVTEVVAESVRFLESANAGNRDESTGFQPSAPRPAANKINDPFEDDGKPIDLSDDDLPF